MQPTSLSTWQMMPLDAPYASGHVVSEQGFDASDWLAVRIPTTIVGGLHQAGAIEEPYTGRAIAELAGYKDVPGHHVNVAKPADSPFDRPWWFRTTFSLPSEDRAPAWTPVLRLRLRGVNPAANVWLNGRRIAAASHIVGTYTDFELPITGGLRWDGENVLALEVLPVEPDDLAITFIDWNPMPPDDCAGIWRPVEWRLTGPVGLKQGWVATDLAGDLQTALLRPQTTVSNDSDDPVTAVVTFTCDSISLRTTVRVEAHSHVVAVFDPVDNPPLRLDSPRLWWPYQLGAPERYHGEFTVAVDDDGVSDRLPVSFGIRHIEAPLNEHGAREFRINGRPVPINAAAWTPDMLLREDPARDRIDLDYVKNMHLNAVRLEGKLAFEAFWEICDAEGILVLAGWPCCNHFEHWDRWKPGDLDIATRSLRSQLRRLRSHPSLIAWLYGSDAPPPPHVERAYLAVLDTEAPGLPRLSSATATPTSSGGNTGVKMTGPYDYVPPTYWYDPSMPGAASAFNTETCPACALPMTDSIRRMTTGGASITSGDPVWRFHCAGEPFGSTKLLEDAITSRFGAPVDLDELVAWSQLLGYETWRAMYEAFRHRFPVATGVVGWMLNSSWPSLLWQLYDYWLHPTASFYGTQLACRTVHAYLALDDRTVYLRNDGSVPVASLQVSLACFDAAGMPLWSTESAGALEAGAGEKLVRLPKAVCEAPVALCYLTYTVTDASGTQPPVRSVYVLPNPDDRLVSTEESDWYYTPVAAHADLSSLRGLPRARLSGTATVTGERSPDRMLTVTVRNESTIPTLPVLARIRDTETGEYLAPVYWDQNYVGLLPGEEFVVSGRLGRLALDERHQDRLAVALSGLRVETLAIPVTAEHFTR